MDIVSVANFIAAIVSIVGGLITITRALRPTSPGAVLVASTSPTSPARTPAVGAAPIAVSSVTSIVANALRYGLVLGVIAAILAWLGGPLVNLGQSLGADGRDILTMVAWAIVLVVAGLVPARRTGSIWAGLLAGLLCAVGFAAGIGLWFAKADSEYIGSGLLGGFATGVVATIILGGIAAFVGRWVYQRSIAALAPAPRNLR